MNVLQALHTLLGQHLQQQQQHQAPQHLQHMQYAQPMQQQPNYGPNLQQGFGQQPQGVGSLPTQIQAPYNGGQIQTANRNPQQNIQLY